MTTKNKLVLLRFICVLLAIVMVWLYIWNPFEKNLYLPLIGLILGFIGIINSLFFRKSKIKLALSSSTILLIMIIIYLVM